MSDLAFRFYIPFVERPNGGGIGVTVRAETPSLDAAIRLANEAAFEGSALLDDYHNGNGGGGLGIYYDTDAHLFGPADLQAVECELDGEGVDRTADQGDKEFLSRVDAFASEHPTSDDHDD
jgi:hypothetical protein